MESEKQYSDADILRVLGSLDGIRIVRTGGDISPLHFDPSGFDAELSKMTAHIHKEIEEAGRMCRNFLAGPIIVDTFANHTERREWRHRMFGMYGESFPRVYDKNKLRINNLGSVYSWLQTISEGLRIFKVKSAKVEEIRVLTSSLPSLENYDDLGIEDKIALVDRVDHVCQKFMDVISRPA